MREHLPTILLLLALFVFCGLGFAAGLLRLNRIEQLLLRRLPGAPRDPEALL